jgi:hypothetical protein
MTPELREAIKTILLVIDNAEITNDSLAMLLKGLGDLTKVVTHIDGEQSLLEARVAMLEADIR